MIPPAALPASVPMTPAAPAPSVTAVKVDAFQANPQQAENGMAQSFNKAIDGFSTRAAEMRASTNDMVAQESARGQVPQAGGVQGVNATAPVGGGSTGVKAPMALMVDSFNFAIEASLVSRAATQFTGAVSTLMKGQ